MRPMASKYYNNEAQRCNIAYNQRSGNSGVESSETQALQGAVNETNIGDIACSIYIARFGRSPSQGRIARIGAVCFAPA